MKTKHLFIHVFALLTLCFSAASFALDEFPCGQTITGKVILTQNVECSSNPGVTVDGGSLDLNGFVLSCNNDSNNGVVLTGKGAKLYNGSIGARCDDGVRAQGEGKCQISNVLSTGHNDDGFDIAADGCKLTGNVALGNDDNGFDIDGSKTLLTQNLSRDNGDHGFVSGSGLEKNKYQSNTAAGNGDDGFYIDGGTDHKLQKNLSAENGGDGYDIFSDKNNLKQNRSFLNWSDGIYIDATNSKIQKNVSSTNNTSASGDKDMFEGTAGCGSNTWKNNVFGTSNDGCIQ
ncbi:right-handed parallel beta-helix repeat-containing protein [Pseudomonadota bacterium]